MKTKLLSTLFFLLPATSHAWEIFTKAEQMDVNYVQSKLAMRALF